MKKKYDDYVSERTIPHLSLYTLLTKILYVFAGFNFILALLPLIKETMLILAGGIVLARVGFLQANSIRKCDRDLNAVILDGTVFVGVTIFVLFGVYKLSKNINLWFWIVLVVFCIEVLCVVFIICRYFKQKR